jgi:NTE family protein
VKTRRTAFVLGGGGLLGAVEVGMLRALLDAGIRPDLVVGTSVGALNGALVAADPTPAVVDRLVELWRSASEGREIYGDSVLRQAARAMRTRTHLHSALPLRQRIADELGDRTFADLPVTFQCCAASIERATEHWFTSGRVVDAVVASAAVPGLLPPAEVDGEHYLDGGIVNSIPLGRAVELGAERIFVLQVGRAEKPLTVPTRPWEVAGCPSRSRAGTATCVSSPPCRRASRCTSCRPAAPVTVTTESSPTAASPPWGDGSSRHTWPQRHTSSR